MLYECDPRKNTQCKKYGCGNPCTHTSHKEFAKSEEDPVVPSEADTNRIVHDEHTKRSWWKARKAKKTEEHADAEAEEIL